jgi:hypothetical protein
LYCRRCLLQRYDGLYSLPELYHSCACCRDCCACTPCLLAADAEQLVPPLCFGEQQQARQARYVLQQLLPHLSSLIHKQQAEVRHGFVL